MGWGMFTQFLTSEFKGVSVTKGADFSVLFSSHCTRGTNLCLSSSPGPAAPHKLDEQGACVLVTWNTVLETSIWGNLWHFLPQPGGCLMFPRLFNLLFTYVHKTVQTNCTTPNLVKNYWIWISFVADDFQHYFFSKLCSLEALEDESLETKCFLEISEIPSLQMLHVKRKRGWVESDKFFPLLEPQHKNKHVPAGFSSDIKTTLIHQSSKGSIRAAVDFSKHCLDRQNVLWDKSSWKLLPAKPAVFVMLKAQGTPKTSGKLWKFYCLQTKRQSPFC